MTDKEVLQEMKKRLLDEVGQIIEYAYNHPDNPRKTGKEDWRWIPWKAFTRMLFPMAESIGDLLHQCPETGDNLKEVFNDLGKYNTRYGMTKNIMAIVYRNALMHQDEPKPISHGITIRMEYALAFNIPEKHLHSELLGDKTMRLYFDLTQFYEDLVMLCEEQSKKDHQGRVATRYTRWKNNLDLSDVSQCNTMKVFKKVREGAKTELEQLKKTTN
ncbi:MAG: hypothetical protein HYY10_01460 [Candidatus Liptonbacteria bacterium]|nr:hypothetical protein [Candidatus Liptonbacteria bacterium]